MVTWNLFFGRAKPPARRDLFEAFAGTLAGWQWDVALLQEVPHWWPRQLARAVGADAYAAVRTARHELAPLRRLLARRLPDLLGSWAGGTNAILVRRGTIAARRRLLLRWLPERRLALGVRVAVAGGDVWLVNLHAEASSRQRAARDLDRALAAARRWADASPLIVGGDFNLERSLVSQLALRHGLAYAAGARLDHLLVRGFARGRVAPLPPPTSDRGAQLSDHPPVRAFFEAA